MPKAEKVAEVEIEKLDESPRDKFLRLGPKRVENALKRIKQVSNLAGAGYQWDTTEAQQIVEALFDAVHDLKRKFEKKSGGGKKGFSFKSRDKKVA